MMLLKVSAWVLLGSYCAVASSSNAEEGMYGLLRAFSFQTQGCQRCLERGEYSRRGRKRGEANFGAKINEKGRFLPI